ncbi:hypothetical protein HZS_1221 [Henneguya salminicola]|nr:hypothetical protein HZS_1221 [Henneguya salminicola]
MIGRCWKIWDLDARGYHNGAYRIWLSGSHYIIIGHPFSPYSSLINDKNITIYNFNNISYY